MTGAARGGWPLFFYWSTGRTGFRAFALGFPHGISVVRCRFRPLLANETPKGAVGGGEFVPGLRGIENGVRMYG